MRLKLSEPGDDERAEDRSGARKRQQLAVRAGALVKHLLREDRQERQHRESQECRRRGEDDEGDEAAVVPTYESPPCISSRMPLAVVGGMCLMCSDISAQMTTRNESALSAKQRPWPADRCSPTWRTPRWWRANASGPSTRATLNWMELSATAFGRSFLSTSDGMQRLIRRPAERLREAGDERQHQDVPDWTTHDRRARQRRRRGHLDVLRGEQRPPPVVPIGEHAADEREEHDRQLLQERVEAEEKRGAR